MWFSLYGRAKLWERETWPALGFFKGGLMDNTEALRRHGLALTCLAELEGMKALNAERESKGLAQAYGEDAFLMLADKIRALFIE